VNRLEERLRDAYQAAADTVTREMDPPDLTGIGRRTFVPGNGSRPKVIRYAAPLAAAASVAAIALTLSVIATIGNGHGTGTSPVKNWPRLRPATSVAQGYTTSSMLSTARPRYYLGLQNAPHGPTEYAYIVYSYRSATGQRAGQLTLPRSDLWARAVASLGNGTYVVAATKDGPSFGCRSWLYQFSLTAAGQPTAVKPFVVPEVSGWTRQLSGSGDGQMAVVVTNACVRGRTQPMNSHNDRAIAISVPSGKTTTWSPWPGSSGLVPENVIPAGNLTANGRMQAFVAIAGQPQSFGLEDQAAYVMRTGQVASASRYHLVLKPQAGTGVVAASPSPNGRVTFVMTARSQGGSWHERIGAYSTKTGKLIKVLASTSANSIEGNGYLVPDPSGSHLLVFGFGNHNTAMLDIATHRLTVPHTQPGYSPFGAAW
jgi:hypothetical protein